MPDPITRFLDRLGNRLADVGQPSLDEIKALAQELHWPALTFVTESRYESTPVEVTVRRVTHNIAEGPDAWDRWLRKNFYHFGESSHELPSEEPGLLLRQTRRELKRRRKELLRSSISDDAKRKRRADVERKRQERESRRGTLP